MSLIQNQRLNESMFNVVLWKWHPNLGKFVDSTTVSRDFFFLQSNRQLGKMLGNDTRFSGSYGPMTLEIPPPSGFCVCNNQCFRVHVALWDHETELKNCSREYASDQRYQDLKRLILIVHPFLYFLLIFSLLWLSGGLLHLSLNELNVRTLRLQLTSDFSGYLVL